MKLTEMQVVTLRILAVVLKQRFQLIHAEFLDYARNYVAGTMPREGSELGMVLANFWYIKIIALDDIHWSNFHALREHFQVLLNLEAKFNIYAAEGLDWSQIGWTAKMSRNLGRDLILLKLLSEK